MESVPFIYLSKMARHNMSLSNFRNIWLWSRPGAILSFRVWLPLFVWF